MLFAHGKIRIRRIGQLGRTFTTCLVYQSLQTHANVDISAKNHTCQTNFKWNKLLTRTRQAAQTRFPALHALCSTCTLITHAQTLRGSLRTCVGLWAHMRVCVS